MHKSRPSLMKKLRETALKQKRQDKADRRKQRRENGPQDGEVSADGTDAEPSLDGAIAGAETVAEGAAVEVGE